MKLNYRNQLILSILLIIIGNTIGTLYANGFVVASGFIIAGLIWIVHPVVSADMTPTPMALWGIRLLGLIIALAGVARLLAMAGVTLPFWG